MCDFNIAIMTQLGAPAIQIHLHPLVGGRAQLQGSRIINPGPGTKGFLPAHVVQIHLRVEAQPSLEGAAAVVVLHPVAVEHLDLAIVLGDHQLHAHLTHRGQKQPLQALGVLELRQGLQGSWKAGGRVRWN